MWEELPVETIESQPTLSFSQWLDQYVLVERYERKARELFGVAESISEVFIALRTCPQTPPYHAEGAFVSDGVERALAGLYAIADGASLLGIEEFARERNFQKELNELSFTLQEQFAGLALYLLVHDVAKPNVLVLDAPVGSKGELEGFAQHRYRKDKQASTEERALYGKLFKSHQAQSNEKGQDSVTGFFDRFEIHAHHPDHEKQALSVAGEAFDRLADHFRLTPRDRELVRFAVQNHMRLITTFDSRQDVRAYELLLTRAHRAGLDADDAIDFLLAAVFLDGCVGSLLYEEGEYRPNVDLVLRVFRAEEEVAPHRRSQRRAQQEARRERNLRYALKEAQLDGAALFDLLQTPFGPERGKIADEVRSYVLHPNLPITISSHSHEIEKRVRHARALFDGEPKK